MQDNKIEDAAVVAATLAAEPTGPWAKTVKGVKVAFATKKAVMALWALFFGVTVGTANYASGGMTADELAHQASLEDTIVTLQAQVAKLGTVIVVLETFKADNGHEHDVVPVVAPVFIEHEPKAHEHAVVPVPVVAPVFVEHEHHSALLVVPHEHEAPAPTSEVVCLDHGGEGFVTKEDLNKHMEEYHKPVPVIKENPAPALEYNNGIMLDGEWIDLQ